MFCLPDTKAGGKESRKGGIDFGMGVIAVENGFCTHICLYK